MYKIHTIIMKMKLNKIYKISKIYFNRIISFKMKTIKAKNLSKVKEKIFIKFILLMIMLIKFINLINKL